MPYILIQAMLIALKVAGQITWPWWIVLLPSYFCFAIAAGALVLAAMISFIVVAIAIVTSWRGR